MPSYGPIHRAPPSRSNPHLVLFDTFDKGDLNLRRPDVLVQTAASQDFLYNDVPGGKGTPNAFGYTAPNYDGPPASPTQGDLDTYADHVAKCIAINMHFRGAHLGAGEYAGGTRSGLLYIKGAGYTKQVDGSDVNPWQFDLADAISGTQPALMETTCGGQSLMTLANAPWARFSPYHDNSVAKSSAFFLRCLTTLKSLCENFTLHNSGTFQLAPHAKFIDDNEDGMRPKHFNQVSAVNRGTNGNITSFPDYNAGDPTNLLGVAIPVWPASTYVHRVNIKNHIRNAADDGDLDRFANELCWQEKVNGSWVRRTFKERWLRWISQGVYNGSTPLPPGLESDPAYATFRNELNAFGQELLFDAQKRSFIDVWTTVFGYEIESANYHSIKGTPKFDEEEIKRFDNFGYADQMLNCRITQGSAPTFNISAGLAEVERRLALCDPDLPIRAVFRRKNVGVNTADHGDWEWVKALWSFLNDHGVHSFHWFSFDNQQAALFTAWDEWKATLSEPVSVATTPTFSGGAPVVVNPSSTGDNFRNHGGDLMVRVTNNSDSSVTASAVAQMRLRPADRIFPAQAVDDMSVTVAPGEVKSIGPIPTAFCDVMGNVRISCSAQDDVLIEPYRVTQ
jgi:hypothetical protein